MLTHFAVPFFGLLAKIVIRKVFIDGSAKYISASAAILTRQTLNNLALPLLDATRELGHRLFFSYFWCFHCFYSFVLFIFGYYEYF
jgi:hypothetical protein